MNDKVELKKKRRPDAVLFHILRNNKLTEESLDSIFSQYKLTPTALSMMEDNPFISLELRNKILDKYATWEEML